MNESKASLILPTKMYDLDRLIEIRGKYLEFLDGINNHTLPGWQAYDVIDKAAAIRTLRDLDALIDFSQYGF